MTFTAEVDVAGTPVFEFLFDGSEVRQAGLVSDDGTAELVFGYTVVSGDDDNNGLFLRDEEDYNNPDGPVRLDTGDTITGSRGPAPTSRSTGQAGGPSRATRWTARGAPSRPSRRISRRRRTAAGR